MASVQQLPLSQGYIIVDSAKCSGCQACMLICSLVHEGKFNTALARLQVIQDAYKPWPESIQIKQCRQCPSPGCLDACPAGAVSIDSEHGNVRIIDKLNCTGCQACLDACPYNPGGIVWDFEQSVATKCDLCADAPFLNEPGGPGGKQACVSICSQKAISCVTEIPEQTGPGYDVSLR